MNLTIVHYFHIGVFLILCVGLYGLLISRNILKMIISLQIMLKAALLEFALAGHITGHVNLAQSIILTIIVADTIVAVVGMAFAVQIRRKINSTSVDRLANLKG